MGKIARYLNQLTIGNVFDAPEVLEKYAIDQSALKIKPKIVAIPESTDDIQKLMRFAYQLAGKGIKIPMTVRGSGLDETGADLGNGIIISMEKLDHLLESDGRERLVRVQAGITLKELNTALSLNGLMIPISGHDDDTIGGLISNVPRDELAEKYGGIGQYVERIEVVLPNGDVMQTGRLGAKAIAKKSAEKKLEGKIYNKIAQISTKKYNFSAGLDGYCGITEVGNKKSLDLMPLFFGAQGTLGVITEVILRAVPLKSKVARVVATMEDFETTKKFLDLAKSCGPAILNVYDVRIVKSAEDNGKRLGAITGKATKGYVVFACFDKRINAAIRKIAGMKGKLPKTTQLILESPKNNVALSEFENAIEIFLSQVKSGERVPIMTDFYIPGDRLGNFLGDLAVMEKKLGQELAIYGSYATGVYHLRPKFKLDDEDFSKKAMMLLKAGAFVVKRQGGTLAGGVPEGRLKAIITNADMPEEKKKVYTDIKNTFDSYGIMNPGVKLDTDAKFTVRHFKNS